MAETALSSVNTALLNGAPGNPSGPWGPRTRDIVLGARLNDLAALFVAGGLAELPLLDTLGIVDATELEAALQELALGPSKVNVETLAGPKVLLLSTALVANARLQALDPNGATRTVTLPAERSRLWYWLINTGTVAADIINVVNDAAGAVITLGPGESAYLASDGTVWQAFANTSSGVSSPLVFRGVIALAADFPTVAGVQTGDYFRVSTDVTDNDATRTNTGQVFEAGSEIAWDGAAWVDFGAGWVATTAEITAAADGVRAITPLALATAVVTVGGLLNNGGLREGAPTVVNNAASPYAVLAADRVILCDTTAGPVTLNLPASAVGGRRLTVVRSGANIVTIDGNAAETVDGAATKVLATDRNAVEIVDTNDAGDEWQTVSDRLIIGADVQAWDADLDNLAGLDGTAGFIVKTGVATHVRRSLVAPAAGLTIANPAGTAGNPTFALADDLAALEALDATGGLLAKTAADTYARRTLTPANASMTVVDGDGVAGNPTVDVAAATDALAGKVELATAAEVTTGTDAGRAVTPAGIGPLTAAGRALIDDASAADQRTTLGVGTGDSPTFAGLHVTGDVVVDGGNFLADAEQVLLRANYHHLNVDYTPAVAQTGGLVVNYLPTATATTTVGSGVATPGVDGVSNPTLTTAGAATFAAGDFVMISGSAGDGDNDGVYEVVSHAANLLTLRSTASGVTDRLEPWTRDQLVAAAGDVGMALTKIGVAVLRAGTDGAWEVAVGNATPLTYSDLLTALTGQPLDATLTALAGLDAVAGLVEETGADTFTKRLLGVAAATSVPTRADADARYDAIGAAAAAQAASQPVDADLTAIAALASAADQLPYATGAQAWALTPLTAAGRALIDDASAAAQRTTLALVPGTDVQAQDAGLQSLAALPTVADRVAYSTALDTWAETPLTAAGRALIDDASAAAQLVTLGAQATAEKNAANGYPGLSAGSLIAAAQLPAATDAAQGAVELATAAEVVTGTDATRAVTPAALGPVTAAGKALIDDANAADQRTTLGLADAYVQTADVVVSRAELLALRAVPKLLVAGVAGQVIVPISVQFMMDFDTADYDAPGAGDELEVRRAGGAPIWAIQESTGVINAAADAHRYIVVAPPATAGVYDLDIAPASGVGLELRNNGAAEYLDAGGTALGVLRIRVKYRLHALDLSV